MDGKTIARFAPAILLLAAGCPEGPQLAAPRERDPDGTPSPEEAEPLARLQKLLLEARSVQWRADVEVLEGAEDLPAISPGAAAYRFQVQGPSRLYWTKTEARDGKTTEAWYRGLTLYTKGPVAGGGLESKEVGTWEGECVLRSLIYGGISGWRMAHEWEIPLAPPEVSAVREVDIDGRAAILLEHNLKLGGICGIYKRFAPVKLWIDKESGLPIRRELAVLFTELSGGDREVPFRAREVYSEWKLGEELPESVFRVEGMGPPEEAADLPRDPDRFEEERTAELLGAPVRHFPGPQGVSGFDELPPEAPEFSGEIREREPMGPPPPIAIGRKRVRAKGPDGKEFVAYCGHAKIDPLDEFHESIGDTQEWEKSLEIAPGKGFPSNLLNRRHRYGLSNYQPPDIYIGNLSGEVLDPVHFFRDVGSHSTRPHSLAIDRHGRCHLAVCDVVIELENRFKLYWAVGDPSARRWEEVWLIDCRREFTGSATPISRSLGDSIQLVWEWSGAYERGAMDPRTGLYHLEWTPAGFGRKVRVARCSFLLDFAAEVDEETGLLVLAFNDNGKTFVASRRIGGAWTRPKLVWAKSAGLSLERAGAGSFVLRFHEKGERLRLKEVLLTFQKAQR